MFSEQDARLEINEALQNRGWILTGKNKNVLTEVSLPNGRADYILQPKDWISPLIIIEAKKKGKDLNTALTQACSYAKASKAPIVYASDGSTIKTIHMKTGKPLLLNDEEIDQFIDQTLALKYLDTNEYNTLNKKVIQSRRDLIAIFSDANKELRKEGLSAGIERFSEFCNILFLKIFSEQLERAEQGGYAANLHHNSEISSEFRWDNFKRKSGQELLSYVNDTVIRKFSDQYGKDIFEPLQLKNPVTLKKIIDNLDPLSLVDTNSDIKGDAFEYFLKAYLANQNKDLGEYFTPRHIVKTLVKLINPKFGEKIYDPFCGTGGMLIESFKHIYNKMPINERSLDFLKKETIFGGEITKNARITKMNMILTGDGHNNIVRHDSLNNPVRGKYDIVITNMPFSLGSFGEYSNLYKLGSAIGNSLCVEHCFDAIKPKTENDDQKRNPRIGMIVPEGILFDRKFTKLRDFIYRNSIVQNIVSLPQGSFKPYTDVKTSILYLTQVNKKKPEQKSVWHFTVKNDGYTLNTKRQRKDGENDLDIFLSFNDIENKNNLLEIGFNKLDVEAIKNNDYISIPSPYKKFEFYSSFKTLQLGELVEELTTRNTINATVWSVTNKHGGTFRPQKDVFEEQIASDSTENYKLVDYNYFAYSPPRINVGSIALNLTKDLGCVSPMYVVFKIKNERIIVPKYLYWLLQSKQLKEQIKFYAFGSVRQTLNFSDFCKITIPLPDFETQEDIVAELESYNNILTNTKKSIDSWKPYFLIDKKWQIVKIREICNDVAQYGLSKDMNGHNNGYPILRMGNLKHGFIDFSEIKHVNLDKNEFEKFKLNKGDILFNRTNSFELVGKTSIFKSDIECCFASYLVRIKVNKDIAISEFVNFFMNTDMFQKNIKNHAKQSNNQANINAQILLEQQIPLPSISIQQQIIDKLEIEYKMIENQKNIIKIFEYKIESKLNSLWESTQIIDTEL